MEFLKLPLTPFDPDTLPPRDWAPLRDYGSVGLPASEGGVLKAHTYENRDDLIAVEIPEGVREIHCEAFGGCRNLRAVRLPSTLRSIRTGAFRNCVSLTEIHWHDEIEDIDLEAFAGCAALTSVTLPAHLSAVGGFEDCTALASVTLPKHATAVTMSAFACCSSLKRLTLSDDIHTIDSTAFVCAGLEEINIPRALRRMGNGVFGGCPLIRVRFPPCQADLAAYLDIGLTTLEDLDPQALRRRDDYSAVLEAFFERMPQARYEEITLTFPPPAFSPENK